MKQVILKFCVLIFTLVDRKCGTVDSEGNCKNNSRSFICSYFFMVKFSFVTLVSEY